MAIYLIEHQVGFDPVVAGFPGLGSCMAVALLTTRGIYGFHFTPAPIAQADQFSQYIINNRIAGEADLRLYGSCYWANRYHGGAEAQWTAEMTAIAAAIGFHGSVRGFDTSSRTAKTDPNGTTYLEYRVNGNRCSTFYKKSSKMAMYKPLIPAPAVVQRIKPNPAIAGQYIMGNPFEQKNFHGAYVMPTRSNEGELHQVGLFGKYSFDVP